MIEHRQTFAAINCIHPSFNTTNTDLLASIYGAFVLPVLHYHSLSNYPQELIELYFA
uniref:Uncharacterized protein n=1 Tax=Ascaris lumbricoides TaxID=6252 RepID=A0A0M3HSI7_ASCLU